MLLSQKGGNGKKSTMRSRSAPTLDVASASLFLKGFALCCYVFLRCVWKVSDEVKKASQGKAASKKKKSADTSTLVTTPRFHPASLLIADEG